MWAKPKPISLTTEPAQREPDLMTATSFVQIAPGAAVITLRGLTLQRSAIAAQWRRMVRPSGSTVFVGTA